MFSRRDALKWLPLSGLATAWVNARIAEAREKRTGPGRSFIPAESLEATNEESQELTDEVLFKQAVNLFIEKTGTLCGIKARNSKGLNQSVILAQFQRLRKESPFELCGFLNRYMRILLHVAGVQVHDGFAKLLKQHESDVRYKPEQPYPWLRQGGVPHHSPQQTHGPTGRTNYVAYDLSSNPACSPRYVKDIDAFNDQETLADFLWAPVSCIRDYVRSRPGIILSEVDAYVKIEPFQLEAFVWLREAVKRSDAEFDVYEPHPLSSVDTFEHFCNTIDGFRNTYGNRKIMLNCSPATMEAIGRWVLWHVRIARALATDSVEPFFVAGFPDVPKTDWPAINAWMRERDITLFCPDEDEGHWPEHTKAELIGHAYRPLKNV